MEIVIQPDHNAATLLAAKIIAHRLRKKPHALLGLATGRTMTELYDHLVAMHHKEKLDFSLCRTVNLDEFIGIAPEDPSSYRYYMNSRLFSRVNIDIRNTHLPNGMASDLEAEAENYERTIKEMGGIDLQLLGIGADGHIGFNEPLSALHSRTRDKTLTPGTAEQNAYLYGDDPQRVPKRAFTMGVGTILEAREILLVATGESKAEILARAMEGPITGMISASALQLHANYKVIVDEAASSELKGKDYYRWIFQNEPEWEEFR